MSGLQNDPVADIVRNLQTSSHQLLLAGLNLHGLVYSQDGAPLPLVLSRTKSFPRPLYTGDRRTFIPNDISPLNVSSCKIQLEARIDFKDWGSQSRPTHVPPGALGRGLSSVVYPIKVETILYQESEETDPRVIWSDSSGEDIPFSIPDLCIKIARPHYARHVARDAWFYERLDLAGLTGVVTPRCYGVFQTVQPCVTFNKETSRLELNSGIPPEIHTSDIDKLPKMENQNAPKNNLYNPGRDIFDPPNELDAEIFEEWEEWGVHGPVFHDLGGRKVARLPGDGDAEKLLRNAPSDVGKQHSDDVPRSFANSQWHTFGDCLNGAFYVTATVVERLGDVLSGEDMTDEELALHEKDIEACFSDLTTALISQEDEAFRQVLRAPPAAQRLCPRHEVMHQWFIVDWDSALLCIHDPSAKGPFRRAGYEVTRGFETLKNRNNPDPMDWF